MSSGQFSLLIVVLTTILATPIRAEMIVGAGVTSCGELAWIYREIPDKAADVELNVLTWAQGFISGFAAAREHDDAVMRNLHSMSVDGQTQWLRSYCNNHPLAQYGDAASALYFKLKWEGHPGYVRE
jgi:hypothetical protein